MIFTSKQPHSQCVTFRTTERTLLLLNTEAQKTNKSLSTVINNKLRNAFNILFSAIEEKKENG